MAINIAFNTTNNGGNYTTPRDAPRPNLTPFDRVSAHLSREERRELLSVEDWAEIRRLHRAEGLPIKTIARDVGGFAEHGACGGGLGRAAEV